MERREVFYSHYYFIAFRDRGSSENGGMWTVIPSSLGEWYADPFLFEWEGRCYLFAERMNRWRLIGSIAVCEIREDGSVTQFKEILKEPFHLSYPNVFEHAGQIYMIPESGTNKDIRLYKAINFPYKWEYVKSLINGGNFVDTSFLTTSCDGDAILNSYDWDKKSSCYFRLNLNSMTLSLLPNNPSMMNERNGGNAFEMDGVRFRVLQNCSSEYGSKVMIRRIDSEDYEAGNAADSPFFEISPNNLSLDRCLKPKRCHTYNQSEHLEVIDFLAERFVWFGPVLCVRNKFYYEHHKDLLG